MRLLVLAIACFVFGLMNVAFVVLGNPDLAPLSLFAALAAFGAGGYALYTWKELS